MVRRSAVQVAFWVLLIASAVVASEFFVPAFTDILRGPVLFLLPPTVFSAVGLGLAVLASKAKMDGKLKMILILTGLAAAGFIVSIVLHNGLYALAQVTGDVPVLSHVVNGLQVAFFLIAVIACPLAFLCGALGSIVMFVRGKS